ncbi:MAG: carboxymuconolactone decarboxylase family protein [Gammaproteobacteria bacterium]
MTTRSNARLRLVERDEAAARLHPLYDRADAAMRDGQMPGPTLFGNQIRALAHNPALLAALTQVYSAFAETGSVDRKLVEMGILIVSRVNACQYCVHHHAPLAHGAGLTQPQLEAIQKDEWNDSVELWSEEERLVIRYAEQMTTAPHAIRDELFTQMRARFTDRQIVELTLRFALCSAWNKFNDALQLDTESAVQQAFAELGV